MGTRHLPEGGGRLLPGALEARRMVAVTGAKGGVGTSLVAVLLAAACARHRRRVVLVDLDLCNGAVAYYTDVVARRSVADVTEAVREQTDGDGALVPALREAIALHPSGLALLLAPEDIERGGDVTGPQAWRILSRLREDFDLVVVDCGSYVTGATGAALEMADDVLLVATAEVVALRSARRAVEAWRRRGIRDARGVHLVLNRVSRRAEVQPELARQIVPVPVIGQLPAAFHRLEEQVNTGVLAGRPGPVHAAVTDVARRLGLLGVSGHDPSGPFPAPGTPRRREGGA